MLHVLALACLPAVAGTHTWTGAGGYLWSSPGNWSGGAPTNGEAASVVLVFPPAGAKFSTNDIANLTVDQIQVTGDGYQIGATGAGTNLTLRSQILGSVFFLTGSNATFNGFLFNLSTNFVNTHWISVSSGDTATFRSRFTGPGGLQKLANGTARLQGGAPNTYLGDTFVIGGVLELNHSSNAIPGNLIIGNPAQTSTGTVTHVFQHQIVDTANVTVWQNGVFNPWLYRETISSLTISNVAQGSGPSLTVLSNLTSYGQCSFSGILDLAGAFRKINVMDGVLDVTGFIENSTGFAGFFKYGAGALRLGQTNGFNSSVFVYEGKIIAAHNGALGNVSGTTVLEGAALELAAGVTIDEQLDIFGQGPGNLGALILRSNAVCSDLVNLWELPTSVNVPDGSAVATISGSVHGDGGLKKIGPGTLVLSGIFPNHVSGECTVEYGRLVLAKTGIAQAIEAPLHIGVSNVDQYQTASVVLSNNNQIANSVEVFVDVTGLLNLNGFSESIGPLTMRRGVITTRAGTLTLLDDVLVKPPQVDFDSDPSSSLISSNLSLGGVTRTFSLEGNATLEVFSSILDGGASAGLNVIGQNSSTMMLHYGPHTYTGPTTVQDARFWLQNNATPGSNTGGTTLNGQSQLVLIRTTIGNESLTFNTASNVFFGNNGTVWFNGTNSWSGPVNLLTETRVDGSSSPDRLSFSGAITGPGAFVKQRFGTVEFTGPDDNLFTGQTIVDKGVLELSKSSGGVAIPGLLTIGNSSDPVSSAIARLKAPNQIINNAPVVVEPSGSFDLVGFNETIGPLTMGGGRVEGFGTLTVTDDVWCRGTNLVSQIMSFFSLGGSTRTARCETNCTLYFGLQIKDGGGNAGFTKTGPGQALFVSPNIYGGTTTVDEGELQMYFAGTPGDANGGTVVHSNGMFTLYNAVVLDEAITLEGQLALNSFNFRSAGAGGVSNYWGGPINLINEAGIHTDNGTSLGLGGGVSGDGMRFNGFGPTYLTGNSGNVHTGMTRVISGTLLLAKTNGVAVSGPLSVENGTSLVRLMRTNQIGDLSPVAVKFGSKLDLNGFAETVGSLEGSLSSQVLNVTNTFTVGGNNSNTVFRSRISGGGGDSVTNLVKTGTGTMTFGNDHTYNGRTHIAGGTLELSGSLSNSPVYLYTGARLTGSGTLNSLTSSGGVIAPDGFGAGKLFGVLTSLGSVNLGSGSQYQVNLAGTNVPVDWDYLEMDQLQLLGGVLTIPGCSLVVTQNATGALSNQYAIVNVVVGGASMGTFTGYSEGANTISSSGQTFRINYFAGSGNNDIVLTQLTTAPTAPNFTGIVKLPGGIQLNGLGSTNAQYAVHANTNLTTTNWVFLGTVTATNGILQFTDSAATNYPMRFYRFQSQ